MIGLEVTFGNFTAEPQTPNAQLCMMRVCLCFARHSYTVRTRHPRKFQIKSFVQKDDT